MIQNYFEVPSPCGLSDPLNARTGRVNDPGTPTPHECQTSARKTMDMGLYAASLITIFQAGVAGALLRI